MHATLSNLIVNFTRATIIVLPVNARANLRSHNPLTMWRGDDTIGTRGIGERSRKKRHLFAPISADTVPLTTVRDRIPVPKVTIYRSKVSFIR